MPVYINKARAHDQAVKTRRYSQERAEWYDGLRHAFLNYCDAMQSDDYRQAGFPTLDAFRAEGLKVIEGNRDFWIEKIDQGEDDPFAEFKAAMNLSIQPDMTLEQLQAAMVVRGQ